MTDELYKKVIKYIDCENNTLTERKAMHDAIYWFCDELWHNIDEVPKYIEDNIASNQIIVFGHTSLGIGCSICSMVDKDIIYSPLTGKDYKWGESPFKKWAYVEDILTKKILK